MVIVRWKDNRSKEQEQETEDLWQAMALSKHLCDIEKVIAEIECNGIIMVGAMGAAGVSDGKLPDGNDYRWVKRRSEDGKTQYIRRSRK